MKRLSKINDFVKKYQPLIQSIGIVLILITVVLTLVQISLTRQEFEVNEKARINELSPGWKIEFNKNVDDALIDEISVSTVNANYNIQAIRIQVMDGIKRYEFEKIGARMSTGSLKRRLANIYKRQYEIQTEDCRGCYSENTYPIAITLSFERFGLRGDTTILYDYHFRTYFVRESVKLRSEGLEFVKYIADDSATLTRELISYNLASSFLSNISAAAFQIKLSIALQNELYKPVIEYAYSNVSAYKTSVVFATEKGGKKFGELMLKMPSPLYDSVAIEERGRIVGQINANIKDYDEVISSAILNIQAFEKSFRDFEANTHIDSLRDGRVIFGNKAQWEEWARMNSDLVNLVTKKVKI